MIWSTILSRTAVFGLLLSFMALSSAVNPAQLPTLEPGDISITNETFTGAFGVWVNPDGCDERYVPVKFRESVAVRCPGARKVKVFYKFQDSAGSVFERRLELDVNKHYVTGWDAEAKMYALLIPLFGGGR